MKLPVPTTVVTALKTHPETLSFMENHQKSKNPPTFTLKTLKLAVSTPFNCADNARTLPLSPTYGNREHHARKGVAKQQWHRLPESLGKQ